MKATEYTIRALGTYVGGFLEHLGRFFQNISGHTA
jgi:hypothetical protein